MFIRPESFINFSKIYLEVYLVNYSNTLPVDEHKSLESLLWDAIGDRELSPSHAKDHIKLVQKYALMLHAVYGGNKEVLIASSTLHDLGRVDKQKRGKESIDKSVQDAEVILEEIDYFSVSEIKEILTAIREHDQPDLTPSTIEGRILKDADFLAGFGAQGIMRIAMWAGETSGGVEQIRDRLEVRMPKRIEGLEFPESKRLALKEMAFVRLFSSQLKKEPQIEDFQNRGIYILFEGISGSGKDTQALLLQSQLKLRGQEVKLIVEPSDNFKQGRKLWGSSPWTQTYLLLADRYDLFDNIIRPALHQNEVVIGVRGYISNLIYQGWETGQSELIEFYNSFIPRPNIIFILDVPPDIAMDRIEARAYTDNRKIGDYERSDRLSKLRMRYIELAQVRQSEGFVVIDGTQSVTSVEQNIWSHIEQTGLFQ